MDPLERMALTIVDDLRHQRPGGAEEAATALIDDFVAKFMPGATRPGDPLLGLRILLLKDPQRGRTSCWRVAPEDLSGSRRRCASCSGWPTAFVGDLAVPTVAPSHFAGHLGARPINEAGFPSYDPTGIRFLGARIA